MAERRVEEILLGLVAAFLGYRALWVLPEWAYDIWNTPLRETSARLASTPGHLLEFAGLTFVLVLLLRSRSRAGSAPGCSPEHETLTTTNETSELLEGLLPLAGAVLAADGLRSATLVFSLGEQPLESRLAALAVMAAFSVGAIFLLSRRKSVSALLAAFAGPCSLWRLSAGLFGCLLAAPQVAQVFLTFCWAVSHGKMNSWRFLVTSHAVTTFVQVLISALVIRRSRGDRMQPNIPTAA